MDLVAESHSNCAAPGPRMPQQFTRARRETHGRFVVCLTGALLLGGLAVAPRNVLADYIHPELVQVRTEKYQPQRTEFAAGTYEYDINWQGISVARGAVTVRPSSGSGNDTMHVTATAQTGRVIDILYRLRHTSESVFNAHSLKPVTFFSHQTENSKTKLRKIEFTDDGTISARLWKVDRSGKEVPEESINFHSDNATFDPITAAFLARSLPIQEGSNLSFDVFNGKHRFLITFEVGPREWVEAGEKGYNAYRVVPSVKKLTDSEGENRLKSATIWITADDRRDVVKIESKVLIGSVRAELMKFTPWQALDPATLRASLGRPEERAHDKRGGTSDTPAPADSPSSANETQKPGSTH